MDFFFRKKALPLIEHKKQIQEQIQELFNLKTGIYFKVKEHETAIYINLLIDKRIIGIDIAIEKSKIPNIIILLLILNGNYPSEPPRIIAKSNFCQPTLMDGRDLMPEIYPRWTAYKTKLIDIVQKVTPFCARVINYRSYKFYGTFHLGAVYYMKNFDNMIVNSFKCKLTKNEYKFLNSASDYTLILSGDCLILFEHIEEQKAKIIFWCSLYAITDIQIIQSLKSATINFYEDKENKDFKLKLYIENIVLFRDTLITKMKALEIKVSVKIIDSNTEKNEKKRLTIKDMTRMSLADLEQNVKDIKLSIDKGEIDEYTINTFTTLCGRAIEELNKSFEQEDEEKQKVYVNMMKEVFKLEKVDELNESELKDRKK